MKHCNCGSPAKIRIYYNGIIHAKCWKCYREILRVIKLVEQTINN